METFPVNTQDQHVLTKSDFFQEIFILFEQVATIPLVKLNPSLKIFLYIPNIEKFYLESLDTAKFWKRWDYQTTWPSFWEICMQVTKQHLELDMEQQTGSK